MIQKDAGVLGDAWDRFRDLFRGESGRAQKDVEQHVSSPDWNKFVDRAAGSPKFVQALSRNKNVSAKDVLHAESMGALARAAVDGEVESAGSSGSKYQIKKLPGGSFGCTCKDWRYRGSIRPGYECKHIQAHKQGKMKVSSSFKEKTTSFFDELSKIRAEQKRYADEDREMGDHGERPFSNILTQDEEPAYYNPNPAQSIDDPEIILGGNS